MGGIATDGEARTSLEGLWACGECASSGVHGANRLASNSLLEALVFGARAAADVRGTVAQSSEKLSQIAGPSAARALPVPQRLRELMSAHVGIERDDAGLRKALSGIAAVERAGGDSAALLNMTAAAKLVTAAALQRRESRGGHFRSDYPVAGAKRERSFLTLQDADTIVGSVAEPGKTAAIA